MRRFKKLIACILMFSLVFTAALPALAVGTQPLSVQTDTLKETVSNRFYQLVDRLIRILGRVLNTVIPGLNWTGKIPSLKDYTAENFYPGKASFDPAPADNARWQMGFGEASFLTDIDPLDGSFYIAGKIGFTEGNVPVAVADDQGVNTFALSDGVTTVTFLRSTASALPGATCSRSAAVWRISRRCTASTRSTFHRSTSIRASIRSASARRSFPRC